MLKSDTILRYPGGKSKLTKFVCDILEKNNITDCYVEPFAGSAGIAINLLILDKIKKVFLNDKDRSIYSVWYSILFNKDKLIEKIINTNITIEEWKKQKAIQKCKENAD